MFHKILPLSDGFTLILNPYHRLHLYNTTQNGRYLHILYERVATHCKRRLSKHAHAGYQNITAKRRIVFAEKDYLLNYILKHYGVNSGFMRKKVMNPSFHGHAPGKDTLRAANAATERGLTGEKTGAYMEGIRAA